MTPITSIYEQLLRDEGQILHAYQDSLGYWTIGVGHLIDPRRGGSIPTGMSLSLLEYDVQRVEEGIADKLPWTKQLDKIRQAVVVNMAFNLGLHGLLGFKKTLALMEQGRYEEAAEEMLKSRWAEQVGERASRLSQQMRTGEWQ